MKREIPGANPGSQDTLPTDQTGAPERTKKKPTVVDNWRSAIRRANEDVVGPGAALKPIERFVALEVSNFMNWDTGTSAYPGVARIARATGLHPATVKRTLASLIKKKWLTITSRGGLPKRGEKRKAHTYGATYPPGLGAESDQSEDGEVVDNDTTSSSPRGDWSSSARGLGAESDPISEEEHLIDHSADVFDLADFTAADETIPEIKTIAASLLLDNAATA